ncbi:chromosomal replication initiator protein DnaA [Metamycoplasma cloacale]|uniref:Chromosomal replication initiator protein DnaA n=1 Tax=Metamycoplasma cloacale TaxID=92401 RepID=A0A2Z4LLL6_9BACT|nr:chromosomal replication initiator protein DnaA [Metamycoplasma cloacale]AWX42623.1 chromosomal replication initiator protein DnaA [Metamycoplasma cloacale]VEU79616.1 chromosomal replication initiator protein DnaA [Metamycoplasma cloacale]
MTNTEIQIWNLSLHRELKNILDEHTYNSLFKNLQIVHIDEPNVYLLAQPSEIKLIKLHYQSNLQKIAQEIFPNKVEFILISDLKQIEKTNVDNLVLTNPVLNLNIKKNLTFENYASGKFNEIAIKAAWSIILNEKITFSPLFIYSSSGLGKTHLLHAIGNELIKKGKTCLYINPDVLTRRLVEDLKEKNQRGINKTVDELTSYDCLMFDDVQQYGNRESTLNVLFNIINTMITNDKQIIICADKKPEELGGFQERFISRFSGGLTVHIESLDINDVIEILKFKLKENDINPELWEDESLKFIARNFSSSIRSIEGAINRVKLFSQNDDFFTYDLTTMKNIFKNVSQVKEHITPDRIIEVVAKYYKIDRKKITANTRKEEVVIARRISMWLIKNNFDLSLQNIGKMFGNQSHSTVIVSLNWIDANMQTNPALKLAIEKIKENINRIL